jgi:hypothetical protein
LRREPMLSVNSGRNGELSGDVWFVTAGWIRPQ